MARAFAVEKVGVYVPLGDEPRLKKNNKELKASEKVDPTDVDEELVKFSRATEHVWVAADVHEDAPRPLYSHEVVLLNTADGFKILDANIGQFAHLPGAPFDYFVKRRYFDNARK